MAKSLIVLFVLICSSVSTKAQNDTYQFNIDEKFRLVIQANPEKHICTFKFYKQGDSSGNLPMQEIDSVWFQVGFRSLEPIDLNKDGQLDFRISYGTGARGANELYHVFLWDSTNQKYSFLKEASRVPNIHLNQVNQIEGIYFTARTTFVQFILRGDELRNISSQVCTQHFDMDLTTIEYYKYEEGTRHLVRKDSVDGLYPMPDIDYDFIKTQPN